MRLQLPILAFWFCSVATSLSAVAPDSIVGKVFRSWSAPAGVSGAGERTIVFYSNQRYVYLVSAGVSFVTQPGAQGKVLLVDSGPDGWYSYERLSENTARIVLTSDSGIATVLPLSFVTSEYGGDPEVSPFVRRYTFQFTDIARFEAGPTANISIRANLAAGRSISVGVVVPGAYDPPQFSSFVPPQAMSHREVLIRVVGAASLQQFGIGNGWSDPDFRLFRDGREVRLNEFHYSDWDRITFGLGEFLTDPSEGASRALRKIFGFVGAFPLVQGSKDAVAVVRLPAGAYTIEPILSTGDAGGEVLIEVYFLP